MGANEVGVKRAEARPSLRSQFRIKPIAAELKAIYRATDVDVARGALWGASRLAETSGCGN